MVRQNCGRACFAVLVLILAYYANWYYPEHVKQEHPAPAFECGEGYVQTGRTMCEKLIPNTDTNPKPSACPTEMITTTSGKCMTQEGDGESRYYTRLDPAGITQQ